MKKAHGNFPFSTSFQFRDEERAGLEALFERVFFDRAFDAAAREALSRTLYVGADDRKRIASAGSESAVAETGEPARATSAVDDAPRYVLLCRGASGCGKARTVRHLSARARDRQIPIYEVHHHDVEGIPFKPFIHAIRSILKDHDPGAVLQNKYRHGLEALIPEVFEKEASAASVRVDSASESNAGTVPVPLRRRLPEALDAERVRTFDAICQLLLEVTAKKPLLLIVHDLHWSDQPTIELLRYIGRNLQLRNSAGAGRVARGLFLEAASSGPEVDGFDSEEWRALVRQSAKVAGYLGAWPSALDEVAPGRGEVGSRSRTPLARLMILGTYRGFSDREHYLERAIASLGEESFSYHCELDPLGPEEADVFIRRSLADAELDGHALEVRSDAVEAIHEATEGFPSFTQELFRALYLHPEASGNGTPSWVWTGEKIGNLLSSRLENGDDAQGQEERAGEKADAPGTDVSVLPPAPDEGLSPLGRRHEILRLRLADLSAAELKTVQVLSVARRPLTASFVARILGCESSPSSDAHPPVPASADGGPDGISGVDDVRRIFEDLEQRGYIERSASDVVLQAVPGEESAETSYFFGLWDYARVLEETLDVEAERGLHQRIGEEIARTLDAGSNERAFEVYYHLYRGGNSRDAVEPGLQAARRLCRSYALVKARHVYECLAGILAGEDDALQRMRVLEEIARVSAALRDAETAEQTLKRIQSEGSAILSPERRAELQMLEAEVVATHDPARGLKLLGRVSRLLDDENSPIGARLQLATARMRLQRQDVKRAINVALTGVTVCQKVGPIPELGELYRVLANSFYRKGDYTHAVDNYLRALDAFEKQGLKEASVDTLDDLGRVYLERGHYFRAARYLYKSLEIRRRLHDVAGLCRCYDQLALVYLRSGDDLKTIENLNRTLSLKERIGDLASLNPTLAALGDLYRRLGQYDLALEYFNWAVRNSQRLGDTAGLVEAFCKLGRVYFEIGDLRQASSFSKQVSILASEFKLKAQEADGALLEGSIKSRERDWAGAEKLFKSASDAHGKLGNRRREASALLDLAELKLERELFDEALKLASKGQVIADELKAIDLQLRAQTLKANVYRFLKGGNVEKASECLQRALELSQGLSDANLLFDLFYSLAKVSHSQREFAEAANYYGKAELTLKKIGDALSDDLAARFFEDSRRKVFSEDLARFRKEAHGRTSRDLRETPVLSQGLKERPCSVADYKEVCSRILRVHASLNQLRFHDRLLSEALELTGADRGFILRVQNRQYIPAAFRGFGKSPAQHPEYMAASHIAQESIRKGRSILAPGRDGVGREEMGESGGRLQLGGLVHRFILSVPFMTEERIFGGVYLDKPAALGQFSSRDQVLADVFAQQCAVALDNRREFETSIREPLTGLYTPSYFVDRLREAYRLFNLHGKVFALIAYHLPSLEDTLSYERGQLGGRLVEELNEELPPSVATCWGNPVLGVLLEEGDAPLAEQYAEAGQQRLEQILSSAVEYVVIPAEAHYQQGADMYFEARRRLIPKDVDQVAIHELQSILSADIPLRDAKRLLERHKIEMTLQETGGNITHAARQLGIHRPQLSNLLKKHDLKREVFEQRVEE